MSDATEALKTIKLRNIGTKDGINIDNIPSDVPNDSPVLKEIVSQIRAAREQGIQVDMTDFGQLQAKLDDFKRYNEAQKAIADLHGIPDEYRLPGGGLDPSKVPDPFAGTTPLGMAGAIDRGVIGGLVSPATMVGDPLTELWNSIAPKGWESMPPSQGVQKILSMVGVAEPKSAVERLTQSLASGGAGSGASVAAGRAMSGPFAPTTATQRVGQALSDQPVAQVMGGAAGSGAAQLASEGGADTTGQLAAGLVGSLVGAQAGMVPKTSAPLTAQEQAVQNAQQLGGKLMTTDVFPPKPGGQFMQNLAEKVPVIGTGPLRAGQQEDRLRLIGDLLEEYGAGPAKEDFQQAYEAVGADLLKNRGDTVSALSKQKGDVIERLSQPEVGKNGAMAKSVVPVTNTIKAIDDQIAYLKGLRTEDAKPVIAKLEDWKKAVQDQNLSALEDIRKYSLSKAFTDPTLASSRDLGEKVLSSIYGPLKQDMGDYIRANGDAKDMTQWQAANAGLKELADETRSATLKAALNKGDIKPSLVNRMLLAQDENEAKLLFKNLSPEGRANAQAAILSRAAQQAVTSGSDNISPEKFMTAVQKLGGPVGVFFSDTDKAKIQGLIEYLDATRRAGQARVNAPTGQMTLIPSVGLGSAGLSGALPMASGGGFDPMAGAIGGLATLATVGGLARIYESAPVRDLLIKYAKAKPEAKAYLFQRLSQVIRAEQGAQEEKPATGVK